MQDPEYAQEIRKVLLRWRQRELDGMTRKLRAEAPALEVESDMFVRLAWVLLHSFRGAHHVPKVQFGARWISLLVYEDLATTDSNLLTRLVVAAHAAAVRLSITSGGLRQVRVWLHPRKRAPSIMENHPTLEDAATQLQESWAPCPVDIPRTEDP